VRRALAWWVVLTLFLLAGEPAGAGRTLSVRFSPSDQDFANPERGFMAQRSVFVDQPLDPAKIRALEPSDSLVWIYFRLDDYRDPRDGPGVTLRDYRGRLIDEAGIETVRSTFAVARRKGLKLVIRFIYNFGPGSTTDPDQATPDAPIELVRTHIDQLAPILAENADVLAAMQAGFVGHWGEWHSSKYLHSLEYRREIVARLLAALPRSRMLQLRYPRYKELFFGGPLMPADAFSGTDASRVGHHNDSFLAGSDDGGTYGSRTPQAPEQESSYCAGTPSDVACWKEFVAQEGRFSPIGGETFHANPPRTDCPNALAELERLHWSFMNNGYRQEVLDGWRAQGCMSEIRRRLGYRFVLEEALLPKRASPGDVVSLRVVLRNEGFAAMYNPRPVFIVLDDGVDRYRLRLSGVDPRRWEPGEDHSIGAKVRLPVTIEPGVYSLRLWLPDKAPRLRDIPAYSVRFANANVWDAASGSNVLIPNFSVE
jgi:hypothetical protein